MRKTIFVFAFFMLALTGVFAQTAAPATPDTSANTKAERFVTKHSIKIDGKMINYTATAGTLILKNEKDEPIATFGFIAYTKDGETDLQKRPVMFAYNGGPGSSSLWLHMGALGPRRVAITDLAPTTPAPYKLEDNVSSVLDVTDIVMIDPVGTGLSHAIGKAKNKDFWGVDQDIKSISGFVKSYITEFDRWNSPKYLLGESYGTMRSAGVVDFLQERLGITVNGVVLVSSVLDLRQLTFAPGDDISYIMYLPTYAATALFHNKITKPANFSNFIKEVTDFAEGEYTLALTKGDKLDDAEKDKIATKLSAYIGLSKDYILKSNLRVSQPQFCDELLRNEHLTVGRLDSRFKGINQKPTSEFSDYDPQSSAISPAYTATFLNYLYNELKVNKTNNYHISAYSAEGFNWDWKHTNGLWGGGVYTPNTGVDLADAMSKNPNLKLLVLNGYYDLATPFFGTEYTMDHLGLEKNIQANITMKYFDAGHMMYVNPASLAALKKDVADFITDSSK
ncbi:MAG: carboxypeptidase [Bacteroidota bacterium]|nr:carboxypeptidase [Bacteroidota bacterium]